MTSHRKFCAAQFGSLICELRPGHDGQHVDSQTEPEVTHHWPSPPSAPEATPLWPFDFPPPETTAPTATPAEVALMRREVVAAAIYDAMRENDPEGQRHPWVPGGNSDKQEEARRRAEHALSVFPLSVLSSSPATPTGEPTEDEALLNRRYTFTSHDLPLTMSGRDLLRSLTTDPR